MKKILLLLFFLCLFVRSPIFASGTQTVNGIPLEDIDYGNAKGVRALHFTGYTFGTTAVYNESGATSTTSGMVAVGQYTDKSVGIRLTNISGGGTLTVKINEYIGTTTFPFEAVTINLGTTSTHYAIPISEYCEHLSISGVTSTGTITADIIGNYVWQK